MDRKFEITDAKGGSGLSIRVVTRAAKTEFAGLTEEGVLKVRLQASPAGDPAANDELVGFLAEALSVEPGKIEIVAGAEGRDKLVSIEGISVEAIQSKIDRMPRASDD